MKQQKQIIALVVLILVAVGIWAWQWYEPSKGSKGANSTFSQTSQTLNFPNPEIRWDEVERRRKAEYKGEGINPFSTEGPRPPVVPVRVPKPGDRDYVPPPPPPPPPAPELPANWKFFGYGNVPNNTARRAFLEDGEEVYIVNEGDTVMGRFKVLKINNASIEFEEVGTGRRGQKNLEDQGPSA
jgi:hypothetical protein